MSSSSPLPQGLTGPACGGYAVTLSCRASAKRPYATAQAAPFLPLRQLPADGKRRNCNRRLYASSRRRQDVSCRAATERSRPAVHPEALSSVFSGPRTQNGCPVGQPSATGGGRARIRPCLPSGTCGGQRPFRQDGVPADSPEPRPAFQDVPCPRPRSRAERPHIRPAFPCFRSPWARP